MIPSGTNLDSTAKVITTQIEKDVMPAQDINEMRRESRLNSCLTDKDPSLLPQNDGTYSDKDVEP